MAHNVLHNQKKHGKPLISARRFIAESLVTLDRQSGQALVLVLTASICFGLYVVMVPNATRSGSTEWLILAILIAALQAYVALRWRRVIASGETGQLRPSLRDSPHFLFYTVFLLPTWLITFLLSGSFHPVLIYLLTPLLLLAITLAFGRPIAAFGLGEASGGWFWPKAMRRPLMRALIVIGLLWATLISATEPYAVALAYFGDADVVHASVRFVTGMLATFLVQGVIAHAFLAVRELESD